MEIEKIEVNDLKTKLRENPYTILVVWGPWCPWCRHELGLIEDLKKKIKTEGLTDIAILGLVHKADDYKKDDIAKLFSENQEAFDNFALTSDLESYVNSLLGYKLTGYPTILLVDESLEMVGEELYNYYESEVAAFINKEGISEAEYEKLYQKDFDQLELDDKLKIQAYDNFLALAL